MRKLNGITINGEFLGKGVVVNGMFRAICAISPAIMREFVLIINKIEALEEAVKISNFNCDNDKNCMSIEFENKRYKGIASLYFKLYNGEPELTDCELIFDNKEYSTLDGKIPNTDRRGQDKNEAEKQQRLQKLLELKEAKLQQLKNDKLSSLKKSRGPANDLRNTPIPNRLQNQSTNPSAQKPMSSKEQKVQELLEKKRKLLEAKKNAAAGDSLNKSGDVSSNLASDGVSESAINNAQNTDNVSVNNKPLSKEGGMSVDTGKNSFSSNASESTESTESIDSIDSTDKALQSSENNQYKDSSDSIGDAENEYGDYDSEVDDTPKLSLDDFTEEELANLSLEELEQLEAELSSGDSSDEYYDYQDSNAGYSSAPSFDFAQRLSQELAEGISTGLSQGLAQGLSQGLSQGFQGLAQGYGPSSGFNQSYDNSFGNQNGFGGGMPVTSPQRQMPNFEDIDSMNSKESQMAHDSYDYDVNANVDDLADFYSNFYDSIQEEQSEQYHDDSSEYLQYAQQTQSKPNKDEEQDELEQLQAELSALDAGKNRMSLDEYMARQRAIEEAKEQLRRRKIKIVGSGGRVNAKAIQNGVFVSGSKVYKWGDARLLDD